MNTGEKDPKDFKTEDVTYNLNEYEKHFSDSKLLDKLAKVGKAVGATVLYPVLLLYHLLKSDEVNLKEKAMIIGTLGYFILPFDLIPDVIPGVGYTDDAAALMACLTAMASCITEEIQQAAKDQLKDLLGEFDDRAVEKVSEIIRKAHKQINK